MRTTVHSALAVVAVLALAPGALMAGQQRDQTASAAKKPGRTMSVAPASVSLETGQSSQLQAIDAYGRTLTGVTWSSDNVAAATVNASGLVNGVGAGVARVTARAARLSATASITVSAPVSTPPAAGNPTLPFGPTQLYWYFTYGQPPFTGAYENGSYLEKLNAMMPAARAAGMKLIVKIAPAHDSMMSPGTGCFDINLWKASVDQIRSFDFGSYFADGTLLGLEVVNEPHASDWCTATQMRLTKEQVEEMCAYAKSIWPTVPTGAGRSDWVYANAPWRYLDFANSQYHMRKGDIETWKATTAAQTQAAGVANLLSLDFLAGQLDNSPMTADQLRYFGTALAGDTTACALTGYSYDNVYMAQPGIAEAFSAIATVAASHGAPPCFVGKVK